MTPAPRARSARAWSLAAALAVVAAVAPLGCRRDIHLLSDVDFDGGGNDTGLGGAMGGDGAVDTGPACTGQGPPIMLPTANGPTCAAALATRGQRFAVCTCNSVTTPVTNLGARLRTYAFDSTDSSYSDDKVSAAVGIDGALIASADLEVEGAIYVAGGYVTASGHLQAGASFRSAGPLTMLSQQADLLGDAYVNGPLTGIVNVSGTLYVPTTVTVGDNVDAKAISPGPLSVSAPCDCSNGFVDVAGAIAAAQLANGDAAAGFTPGALVALSAPAQLTLGCGTYFLDAIGALTAPVSLVVHGHALLAVAGSVALGVGLNVMLDPGAELDLLVGGWFTTSGGSIGAPNAPARFRIWIASTESVVFDHEPTVAAIVHAPGSSATATNGLTLSGSLFVNSLSLGDASEVHYDRAILSVGYACGEPTASPVP